MTALPPTGRTTNRDVAAADVQSVFHSWSAQGGLAPLPLGSGDGAIVRDVEGRPYIDLSSQLVNVNIGYGHPRVVEAIQQQAAAMATMAPAFASDVRAQAAELILERAPEGFEKVFFTNGGADANENAMRMARLSTGRSKIISTYRSYHGNTGSAIVATGDWRRIPNEYAHGHVHIFGPYPYRSPFWAEDVETERERALEHLDRTIRAEGPESIAAILLETVPGTAGILVPPPGYLRGVREIADRYGIILILDEVMAGFGRTGSWLALDQHDVVPDLITFAKGVNSGYVPIGGVMVSERICREFDERVFPGGLTYSGHPLACASVVGALTAMADEDIVARAARVGAELLAPRLAELAASATIVGEARGVGLFHALELVEDAETRAPLPAERMGRIKSALLERGVLPMTVENRIHVVPPLVITDVELGTALDAIEETLRLEAERG